MFIPKSETSCVLSEKPGSIHFEYLISGCVVSACPRAPEGVQNTTNG